MENLHGPEGGVPHTGTTIVACVYPGGVVIGADGRVSVGNYISNRASNKITPLTDNVFLLRSGSAPDTQAVADYVRHFAHQLQAESGGELTVDTVANLVRQINYNNKHLVGAMIVAGYDSVNKGQAFGCPIGGTLVSEQWVIDGSGSTFIWGYCDSAYRKDFTREEAETFVMEALALAMGRDSSSGGCIRLVTLDASGAAHKTVRGDQVPLYQDDLPPPSYSMYGTTI